MRSPGSGTLRRNPEIKLEFDEAEFKKLVFLQRDLLAEGSHYVAQKGRVYYMTCSVLEDENMEQVKWFLKKRGEEFELLHNETVWPESRRNDGFFLAVLERK